MEEKLDMLYSPAFSAYSYNIICFLYYFYNHLYLVCRPGEVAALTVKDCCQILEKELKGKKSNDLICTSDQGRSLTKDLRKRLWKKFKRRMELQGILHLPGSCTFDRRGSARCSDISVDTFQIRRRTVLYGIPDHTDPRAAAVRRRRICFPRSLHADAWVLAGQTCLSNNYSSSRFLIFS